MSIEEEERVAKAGVFDAGRNDKRPERQALGSVMEAPREVPIFATTDVLVVGGGPAGTTAAIAAARVGADVILAERYNHLGGLSTGRSRLLDRPHVRLGWQARHQRSGRRTAGPPTRWRISRAGQKASGAHGMKRWCSEWAPRASASSRRGHLGADDRS